MQSTTQWWDRLKQHATGVRSQGSCGSCWAWAVVDALANTAVAEGLTTTPHELSVQAMVDCTYETRESGGGCNGGWPTTGMNWAKNNGGLYAAVDYSYECGWGCGEKAREDCRKPDASKKYLNIGAVKSASGSGTIADKEEALRVAVHERPVNIYVNADDKFMSYSSGIMDHSSCHDFEGSSINHAVTVMAYGTEGGKDYWLVKNSWGSDWGINGFTKMARGVNQCNMVKFGFNWAEGLSFSTYTPPAPTRLQPVQWMEGCQDDDSCSWRFFCYCTDEEVCNWKGSRKDGWDEGISHDMNDPCRFWWDFQCHCKHSSVAGAEFKDEGEGAGSTGASAASTSGCEWNQFLTTSGTDQCVLGAKVCFDNMGFKDEKGYRCLQWIGSTCSEAKTKHGYSTKGETDLLLNCKMTCGQCTTGVVVAGSTSVQLAQALVWMAATLPFLRL